MLDTVFLTAWGLEDLAAFFVAALASACMLGRLAASSSRASSTMSSTFRGLRAGVRVATAVVEGAEVGAGAEFSLPATCAGVSMGTSTPLPYTTP